MQGIVGENAERFKAAANKLAIRKGKDPIATVTTQETSPVAQQMEFADLLALANITTETFDTALLDYCHPQFMVAKTLEERRGKLSKALAPLGKVDRRAAMNAVGAVLEFEQAVFLAEVKSVITPARKKLEANLAAAVKVQTDLNLRMQKMLKTPFDN